MKITNLFLTDAAIFVFFCINLIISYKLLANIDETCSQLSFFMLRQEASIPSLVCRSVCLSVGLSSKKNIIVNETST